MCVLCMCVYVLVCVCVCVYTELYRTIQPYHIYIVIICTEICMCHIYIYIYSSWHVPKLQRPMVVLVFSPDLLLFVLQNVGLPGILSSNY